MSVTVPRHSPWVATPDAPARVRVLAGTGAAVWACDVCSSVAYVMGGLEAAVRGATAHARAAHPAR